MFIVSFKNRPSSSVNVSVTLKSKFQGVKIATPHLFVKPCEKNILEPHSFSHVGTTLGVVWVSCKKTK